MVADTSDRGATDTAARVTSAESHTGASSPGGQARCCHDLCFDASGGRDSGRLCAGCYPVVLGVPQETPGTAGTSSQAPATL
jgi:hypothetical protein